MGDMGQYSFVLVDALGFIGESFGSYSFIINLIDGLYR